MYNVYNIYLSRLVWNFDIKIIIIVFRYSANEITDRHVQCVFSDWFEFYWYNYHTVLIEFHNMHTKFFYHMCSNTFMSYCKQARLLISPREIYIRGRWNRFPLRLTYENYSWVKVARYPLTLRYRSISLSRPSSVLECRNFHGTRESSSIRVNYARWKWSGFRREKWANA